MPLGEKFVLGGVYLFGDWATAHRILYMEVSLLSKGFL